MENLTLADNAKEVLVALLKSSKLQLMMKRLKKGCQ